MMHSAYKLNEQSDNIQLWCTPFPIWNQSVVPCPVLTIASWPAYRFLRRLVRWLVFQSLEEFSTVFLWSMQSKVLAFLSLLSVLWNSAFKLVYLSFFPWPLASLPFSAIWKASSDNRFVFLHFFFLGWSWSLPPVQCHEPLSIVLQVLCLSDLFYSLNLFVTSTV